MSKYSLKPTEGVPFPKDKLFIPNNNPGNRSNEEDTENNVITLRRYNAEPLDHQQADDNLELLRRRIANLAENVSYLNNYSENIDNYINGDNFGDFIKNMVYSPEFKQNFVEILGDEEFFNQVLNKFFTSEEFKNFIDGRTINNFSENFNSLFAEYLNDYGDIFLEQTKLGDFINQHFNYPTNEFLEIFNELVSNRFEILNKTVINPPVDYAKIFRYIDDAISIAVGPLKVEINIMKATLDSILEILKNIGSGTLNLDELIAILNQISADVQVNAENINTLNTQVTLNTENIALNAGNIEILNANIKAIDATLMELINSVNAAFEALQGFIDTMFGNLSAALNQMAEQVERNAQEIIDLWEWVTTENDKIWNDIIAIWNNLATLYNKLAEVEDMICKLEAEMEAVIAWVVQIDWRDISICNNGVEELIGVATGPPIVGVQWDQVALNAQIFACNPQKFKQFKEDAERVQAAAKAEAKRQREAARNQRMALKNFKRNDFGRWIRDFNQQQPIRVRRALPVHLPGAPVNPGP